MAFPKSVGQGWVLGTDAPRIDRWYDELLANYCIDTSRVFPTGHSSGAQLIVQLLCQGESRFRAIAPVASSMYCQGWNAIPTLLIQGANDMERANTSQDADGRKDLGPYVASNGCDVSTVPYATPGCNSGNVSVNPGCVSYSGCDETLIGCSHNDPNSSNTNHGGPALPPGNVRLHSLGAPRRRREHASLRRRTSAGTVTRSNATSLRWIGSHAITSAGVCFAASAMGFGCGERVSLVSSVQRRTSDACTNPRRSVRWFVRIV